MKACKINTSILLGEKCLRSQLVLSFPTADVPRVASPCIFFWDLPCFPSFFLSLTNKQNKKRKIYTSKGEHGWNNFGGITKVIKSYEGDQFSKISFKGRGQAYFTVLSPKSPDTPPSPFPQAINNDWSLTERFPRSMINKLLPQAARPHFLWVYQRNNLSDILGEHYLQAFLMSCSPTYQMGFFAG